MKNTNISGVVLLCLSISACNHQNEAAHEAELHFNGDTVSVSPTSPIMGKISIDTTTLDTVSESVSGVEIKRKSTDFFRFVKDKTTNRKES